MQIDVDPEKDFHVVIDGAVKALSLDDLVESYQADSINDETLIWQEGFADWMRLDALLAALGGDEAEEADASPEAAPEPVAEAPALDPHGYTVVVAGATQSMTVEALAEAHRGGVVTEETLVLQPGATEWVPLAAVIAGFANNQEPSVAAPQSQPQPSAAAALSAPAVSVPAASVPAAAPAASSAPSVSAASAPMNSLAPTAASIAPMASPTGLAASAGSLADDVDFASMKGSSSWLKRSLFAAGALAFVFVIYQGTRDSEAEKTAQLDGAAIKTTPAAAAVPEEEEPSAWEKEQALVEAARLRDEAAAKAAANKPKADAFGASLSGNKEAKAAAPARKSAWKPKPKKAAKSANSGSSQYDPMNGAL